jgi:protein AIR1/2
MAELTFNEDAVAIEVETPANVYEQTNDDKEKLDLFLKGISEESSSRYYRSTEIICRYCRKPGHKFRNCPKTAIECNLCFTDHDPLRCPLSTICFQCWRRGHQKVDCPEYRITAKECSYCEVRGHSTMECERVWRHYILVDNPPLINTFTVACYNCASLDHFGDFCDRKRSTFRRSTAFDCDEEDIKYYRRRLLKEKSFAPGRFRNNHK